MDHLSHDNGTELLYYEVEVSGGCDCQELIIEEAFNLYWECIQGLANEPICVQYTLNKSWEVTPKT
jgi:hypothetical protein